MHKVKIFDATNSVIESFRENYKGMETKRTYNISHFENIIDDLDMDEDIEGAIFTFLCLDDDINRLVNRENQVGQKVNVTIIKAIFGKDIIKEWGESNYDLNEIMFDEFEIKKGYDALRNRISCLEMEYLTTKGVLLGSPYDEDYTGINSASYDINRHA